MKTVQDALHDLLQSPFEPAVMKDNLPLVREGYNEETLQTLKDLVRQTLEAPVDYLLNGGMIRQNTEGPYNHLSQLAALLLLNEFKDPDTLELTLDLYRRAGDLSCNAPLQDFTLNMLAPLLYAAASDPAPALSALKAAFMDSAQDPSLRSSAFTAWVWLCDDQNIDMQERRAVLEALKEEEQQIYLNQRCYLGVAAAAKHWEMQDLLDEQIAAFNQKPLFGIDAAEPFDEDDLKVIPRDASYEAFQREGYDNSLYYLPHGKDAAVFADSFSAPLPSALDALFEKAEKENMSTEEIQAYLANDPVALQALQEYARQNWNQNDQPKRRSAPASSIPSGMKTRSRKVTSSLASKKTPGGKKKKKKASK